MDIADTGRGVELTGTAKTGVTLAGVAFGALDDLQELFLRKEGVPDAEWFMRSHRWLRGRVGSASLDKFDSTP